MTEFKTGKATVRIHGSADREQLEEATIRFMKGVMKCQKQKEKQKSEIAS